MTLSPQTVDLIVEKSGGYPYIIQFLGKEIFDAWIRQMNAGQPVTNPTFEIEKKLNNDFLAGRWANATDRQRQLMYVISTLENCDKEFAVQELVSASKKALTKLFRASHTNQMLLSLGDVGLIFKNRHGIRFQGPVRNVAALKSMEMAPEISSYCLRVNRAGSGSERTSFYQAPQTGNVREFGPDTTVTHKCALGLLLVQVVNRR